MQQKNWLKTVGLALLALLLVACPNRPKLVVFQIQNQVRPNETNPCTGGLKTKVTTAAAGTYTSQIYAPDAHAEISGPTGSDPGFPYNGWNYGADVVVEAWCYGTSTGYSRRTFQTTPNDAVVFWILVAARDAQRPAPSYQATAPAPSIWVTQDEVDHQP